MNRLSLETSPYLRQHAGNPVDWYPWGEEALQRAETENKPLLVSIGYSTCHWCHVMERESFEDGEVAAFMNAHFINVKIDREERPDLDAIYMDAVQAMTGQGGWPLNVFLLPGGKPFYGGTYFPPRAIQGRASWRDVLSGVSTAFRERRTELDAQAENLTAHLVQSNRFGEQLKPEIALLTEETLMGMGKTLLKQADVVHGGFGRPPKFPQSFSIRFLLQVGDLFQLKDATQHALFSIDRMIDGGIYDQIGGGFARYSTDAEWLAPHFEKMLYDNALLVEAIAEAYQLTGREKYRKTLEEIRCFLERELMHPDGGFYAALDADTEGVEGKFYVWTQAEIEAALGEQASIFSRFYEVLPAGNWEEVNILRVIGDVETIAVELGRSAQEVEQVLQDCRETLLKIRSGRVRPGLDHKILLGWNALMNAACSCAYRATGEKAWRDLALRNMDFLQANLCDGDGGWSHVHTDGKRQGIAFLDDRAYMINAWIELHAVTGEWKWLEAARRMMEETFSQFSDEASSLFYFTPVGQSDLIVRKKEIYDGALPSANAVLAEGLLKLGTIFDRSEWREQAERMVASLGQALVRYPGSFGYWSRVLTYQVLGLTEITLTGPEARAWAEVGQRLYLPQALFLVVDSPQPGRFSNPNLFVRTTVHICRKNTCSPPVYSPNELLIRLKKQEFSD